ncbi:MAG: SEC-C domain-containing protein, partial [Mycobacterium sp.]|nr:SEC-C domain-containing protein [Mycobacterium sp.]
MPGAASEDPADALVAAAQEILLQRGPMDEDDLLDALEAAGADLDPAFERPLSDVLDDHREPVHVLADGRLAWIPSVLAGRIFTHRLTAAEADHDVIPWSADLAALSLLIDGEGFDQLADGSPISEAFAELGEDLRGAPESVDPGGGVLLLPPGKFAELGVGAGDLVGLRLTPQGFKIEKVADVTPTGAGAALTAALEDIPDRPESLDTVVWSICADDDGLFRQPCAPLSEILAANELPFSNGFVAASGFDFPAYRATNRIRFIKEQYELSDDEALAVLAAVHLYDRILKMLDAANTGDADHLVEVITQSVTPSRGQPGATTPASDRTTMGMALTLLAEPIVTAAVLDQIGNENEREATALRFFAESLEPMVPRQARPALRWLRAQAFELLGDLEAAEATLEAAESLDESWPLTLMSLARYAGDRGNAERGLSLLRRAGVPEDHESVVLLKHFLPTPRTGLGRNERCWCGSGRKYKVCHLNREELPLEDRAAWLYQKSSSDLADGPFFSLLLEAATERARHWDFPDAVEHAIDEGLVCDAVLFEGGAFEDFLARRGFLLPEDERSLA